MRNLTTIQTRPRRGFTLVELLVATALTLLIMSILASTFQTAIDSLGYLRAAGELQDRLRTASESIRADLTAPHFDDEAVLDGKLSNVRFDLGAGTPQAGFFRIEQDNPSVEENTNVVDRPSVYSTVATTHRLMFTTKLPGTSRQNVFVVPRVASPNPAAFPGMDTLNDNLLHDPVNFYASRWGVVSWFLVPSGELTQGSVPAQQQPLFNLYRRTLVLAEVPGTYISTADGNSQNCAYQLLATPANTAKFLTASEVTNLGAVAPKSPIGDGSDLVLSNVISFEVKADYTPVLVPANARVTLFPRPPIDPGASPLAPFGLTSASVDSPSVPLTSGYNQDFPFDSLPRNPGNAANNFRAFDTGLVGGTNVVNQSIRVRALQIKIRVYDPKTRSTRQVTLVQDM
ncbi:MAG: prepilin-type N-terminal cleavage/methylation domain-containing protein [Gemmataceae bacterium]